MLRIEEHGPVIKYVAARPVCGRPLYHTAAYWVDGLFIDSTCAHTGRELVQASASLLVGQVVNTHCHEDHIGANGALQRARGVQVLAHPDALPILADPRRQYLQPYRRFFWGWPAPSFTRPKCSSLTSRPTAWIRSRVAISGASCINSSVTE